MSHKIKILDHILDIDRIDTSSFIVDAGCNIGQFIEEVRGSLKCDCKIYAIEPSNRNIGLIKESVLANVDLVQKALVGKSGPPRVLTEFVGPKKPDGTNRYHQWSNIVGYHKDKMHSRFDVQLIEHEVPTITLGDILEISQTGIIDYLKMDIEGAEYEVVEEMTLDVAKNIKQISMELHPPPHDNNKNNALRKKLQQLGFTTHDFPGNELYAFRPEEE